MIDNYGTPRTVRAYVANECSASCVECGTRFYMDIGVRVALLGDAIGFFCDRCAEASHPLDHALAQIENDTSLATDDWGPDGPVRRDGGDR